MDFNEFASTYMAEIDEEIENIIRQATLEIKKMNLSKEAGWSILTASWKLNPLEDCMNEGDYENLKQVYEKYYD